MVESIVKFALLSFFDFRESILVFFEDYLFLDSSNLIYERLGWTKFIIFLLIGFTVIGFLADVFKFGLAVGDFEATFP